MVHTETVKRVGAITLVDGEEGFKWLHVEVVTMGNVRKVVRIPHIEACGMRMVIESLINGISDEERKSSWGACLSWMRRLKRG